MSNLSKIRKKVKQDPKRYYKETPRGEIIVFPVTKTGEPLSNLYHILYCKSYIGFVKKVLKDMKEIPVGPSD